MTGLLRIEDESLLGAIGIETMFVIILESKTRISLNAEFVIAAPAFMES